PAPAPPGCFRGPGSVCGGMAANRDRDAREYLRRAGSEAPGGKAPGNDQDRGLRGGATSDVHERYPADAGNGDLAGLLRGGAVFDRTDWAGRGADRFRGAVLASRTGWLRGLYAPSAVPDGTFCMVAGGYDMLAST